MSPVCRIFLQGLRFCENDKLKKKCTEIFNVRGEEINNRVGWVLEGGRLIVHTINKIGKGNRLKGQCGGSTLLLVNAFKHNQTLIMYYR